MNVSDTDGVAHTLCTVVEVSDYDQPIPATESASRRSGNGQKAEEIVRELGR